MRDREARWSWGNLPSEVVVGSDKAGWDEWYLEATWMAVPSTCLPDPTRGSVSSWKDTEAISVLPTSSLRKERAAEGSAHSEERGEGS